MPNNNWTVSGRRDPFGIDIEALERMAREEHEEMQRLRAEEAMRRAAPSVLSPYHPSNMRNETARSHTYTFRQRMMKLNFTLGWEMEANHAPSRTPQGIERHGDGSVNGEGAEFVVLPAVTKSPRYVLGLLKDLCHAPKLNTDDSCGFHVHVSASNLSSAARQRQWAIATEFLAKQVEDLAFKAVPESRTDNEFCRKIVPMGNGETFSINKYNNHRRYHWLNIVEMFRPNGIRTIENRLLGHTHRWKYVLAWSLFTMELARRGWDLSNRPFERADHVDALSHMLKEIAKDIKPLSKRAEPIPQWVHNGLKTFGIEADAWARPLARLSEVEDDLRGLYRVPYSDNQPEMPNVEEDEESDSDYCPCGCGEEGRCSEQAHSDGDCESDYCYNCHSNGDCNGAEHCDYCQDDRHENGERCGRGSCNRCNPQRQPARPVVRAVPVTPLTEGVTLSNLMDPVRYNITVDPATLYGSMVHYVTYDESVNVTGTGVLPTLPEELALPMTDAERLASDGRERTYQGPTPSRNVTIAASGTRTGRVGYCGPTCNTAHGGGDICGVCNRGWEDHTGHACCNEDGRATGRRGTFLTGGR